MNHPNNYRTLVLYHDCLGKELQAHRFIMHGHPKDDEIAKKELIEFQKQYNLHGSLKGIRKLQQPEQ